MKCGKIVKCYDYVSRPCLREQGHKEGHCNPFSNSYPGEENESITRDSSLHMGDRDVSNVGKK